MQIFGWVKKFSAYSCEFYGVMVICSVSWIVQRMMSVMSLNWVMSLASSVYLEVKRSEGNDSCSLALSCRIRRERN